MQRAGYALRFTCRGVLLRAESLGDLFGLALGHLPDISRPAFAGHLTRAFFHRASSGSRSAIRNPRLRSDVTVCIRRATFLRWELPMEGDRPRVRFVGQAACALQRGAPAPVRRSRSPFG